MAQESRRSPSLPSIRSQPFRRTLLRFSCNMPPRHIPLRAYFAGGVLSVWKLLLGVECANPGAPRPCGAAVGSFMHNLLRHPPVRLLGEKIDDGRVLGERPRNT